MATYEFLRDIRRLQADCRMHQRSVFVLNAMVISLGVYVMLQSLGLIALTSFFLKGPLLVLAPGSFCLVLGLTSAWVLYRRSRTNIFELLTPDISEQAKTAYDNRSRPGVIMDALAQEVKGALSSISGSQIVDSKSIYRRLGLGAVLGLTLLALIWSNTHYEVVNISNLGLVDEIRERAMNLFHDNTQIGGTSRNISSGIYGKPSLAVLQEVKLQVELYPGAGTGSRPVETEAMEHLFQSSSPGQGVAVPSQVYIESLPPGQRDIVKRYFEMLAGL